MPEQEPTPDQWRAIRIAGSAAVRAGAGSGKTTVLAHRFLHLLRPPADGGPAPVDEVGRILAITFTDKAAGEMRKKIRDLLVVEIAQATGGLRQRWERVRTELLGAQISTIHAFCARVVRENPLEAGVDPRASILDEQETAAYLRGVIEAELASRLRAGDGATTALVLRQGFAAGRGGGAVGLCLGFLAWLGTTGRDAAWLEAAMARQAAAVPEAVAAMRAAAARLRAAIPEALRGAKVTDGRARLREAWTAWDAWLARFAGEVPPDAIARLRELNSLVRDARFGDRVGEAIKNELAFQGTRLRGTLADEYGFVASVPGAQALARLVGDLLGAVQARKRADGVLTFDDLVTEARALLAGHPVIRQRYAERFQAVLVDEVQDTDAVQAAVIEELARDRTLFIVGDEKQSIYGFRGADVRVFHEMRERLGPELPLDRNFRSQPAILEFVNALAAETLRRPPGAIDPRRWTQFDDSQRLVPHRRQEWPRPGVRLVSLAGALERRALKAAEARELEARVLAGVIAALHDGPQRVGFGDIAVLFRSLNQVKAYEYALRRQAIPYYVVKGRGFFQCQEVRDVANLLAAVADPRDQVALAAVLRSPFFALDDDTLWRLAWPAGAARARLARRLRRGDDFADLPAAAASLGRMRDLLRHLRRLRSRATIAELIEEALAATDFEAVCLTQFQGAQKVANVRKLIELSRDFERRRLFTLRDFVRTVRELTDQESREPEAQLVGEQDDVVRLMTIHQAKGLEFPVVILVDLGRRLESDWSPTVLDEELGVLMAPVEGAGQHVLANARLETYRARAQERNHAERARLLYVAGTRARDLLVLLEGQGQPKYLESGAGEPHVWCHQVWDLLGRDAVRAFVDGGADETTLAVPGGGEVLIERAERYLGRPASAPGETAEPEEAPSTAAERTLVARVVGFARPVAAELVTSPTALADFRRCPRQYWYRHVLGLPERGTGGVRAQRLGTAAHGVLEGLDLEAASDDDIERRLLARTEALMLRERDLRALGDDLRAAARALRGDVAAGLEVVGREVPFVLALPQGRPQVFVHGRIDLLARRGDVHVVRDYKYAVPHAASVGEYAAQLAPYRLAVLADGARRVDAELLFLRGGVALRSLPALDASAEEAALVATARALAVATAAGDPAAFAKRPPGRAVCETLRCGYVRRCWPGEADAPLTRRAGDSRTGSVAS